MSKQDRSKVVDIRQAMAAQDGFVNLVARLGLGAQGLQSQGTYVATGLTRDRLMLENMYRSSWTTGMLIDTIANDMTRSGVEILGENDPNDVKKIQTKFMRTGVWGQLRDGIKWGRLFGGALSVIVVEGQDFATPLDMTRVGRGQFKGLRVFDRWRLQPDLTRLVASGIDAGTPEFYDVIRDVNTGELSGIRLHHSRVIRHLGIQLPYWESLREHLWSESVIERIQDRIHAFDTATAGMAQLLHKAHLRTVRVDNLRGIFQAGGKAEENLVTMFRYMALLQGTEGVTLLDAKDEFATHQYTFTGIPEVIVKLAEQLSGDSGIPLVKFFGQAPKGLNATGESDLRNYYDTILTRQEADLRDGVERVLGVAHQSELGRPMADDCSFEFVPLWQMSTAEKATVAKTVTETVTAAFREGIIDRHVALKELRQASESTGIFTNIEEEDIADAENEPPLSEQNELDREAAQEAKAAAVTGKKAKDWLRRFTRAGR